MGGQSVLIARRNDAGTALESDGEHIPLTTDDEGNLRVNIGGGTVGTTPGAFSAIATGRKAVTTAGTSLPLVGVSTTCTEVILCADLGNTNPVVVGDASVVAASGSQRGIVLIPGNDPVKIQIDNLNKLYVDSQTNGDAVSFTYFT